MLPLSEPPPLTSEPRSDGEDGAGAGSAADIGTGFFAGALRLGPAFFVTFAAFFTVFFAAFFGAFFAADFIVFFFLRAGAAFFVDFFFAFDFFAMIVLPIHAADNIPSAPNGRPGLRDR